MTSAIVLSTAVDFRAVKFRALCCLVLVAVWLLFVVRATKASLACAFEFLEPSVYTILVRAARVALTG